MHPRGLGTPGGWWLRTPRPSPTQPSAPSSPCLEGVGRQGRQGALWPQRETVLSPAPHPCFWVSYPLHTISPSSLSPPIHSLLSLSGEQQSSAPATPTWPRVPGRGVGHNRHTIRPICLLRFGLQDWAGCPSGAGGSGWDDTGSLPPPAPLPNTSAPVPLPQGIWLHHPAPPAGLWRRRRGRGQ